MSDLMPVFLPPRWRTFARVNWGRWIADCPGPYCTSALQLDPGDVMYGCWDCGAEAVVVWPPNVADIEFLLALRPDEKTRNWHHPETVHDLLAQNCRKGIAPPGVAELGDCTILEIVGDTITHAAISAPPQRMIGW